MGHDYSELTADILPDSRAKDTKGVVRATLNKFASMNWVPIFCANCGTPQGVVPEENCTFVCWLCDPCAEKWGPQYGLAMMPDEVYWAKVCQHQLEKYGRYLTPEELQKAAEASWGPLAKLLKESPLKR